jgi:hypothetical protein
LSVIKRASIAFVDSDGDYHLRLLTGLDGPFRGSFDLKKRSRIRLELVLRQDWHYKTGCLVVPDLTSLLTKIRTLIHEEISLPCVVECSDTIGHLARGVLERFLNSYLTTQIISGTNRLFLT